MILTIYNNQDKEEALKKIASIDIKSKYIIDFKKYRKRRTISQNRLMWMWYRCIEDNLGQDSDELHYILRLKFLPYKTIKVNKEPCKIPISTTKLDTKQFTDYLEKIYIWASQEGIILLRPEDRGWEQFEERYG